MTTIAAVVPDLMDRSRVTAAAGAEVQFVRVADLPSITADVVVAVSTVDAIVSRTADETVVSSTPVDAVITAEAFYEIVPGRSGQAIVA